MTPEQLQHIMESREDEHLEFKEAKAAFEFEELVQYSVALANEGGGRMVLGVTNKQPRKIVGSQAFQDLERTKLGLLSRQKYRQHLGA
jgi:ATP-dependent DNA helicase RecG